jgi:dTDP-4-amino-4,6-dideoxygalactose transaminase
VYHQYTIRLPERRDDVAKLMHDQHGIGTGLFYSAPTHTLPSFGLKLELPATAQAAAQVLSLPVHPSLSDEDLDRIVVAVNESVKTVVG